MNFSRNENHSKVSLHILVLFLINFMYGSYMDNVPFIVMIGLHPYYFCFVGYDFDKDFNHFLVFHLLTVFYYRSFCAMYFRRMINCILHLQFPIIFSNAFHYCVRIDTDNKSSFVILGSLFQATHLLPSGMLASLTNKIGRNGGF